MKTDRFLGLVISPHPPILIPEIGKGQEKEAEKTLSGMRKIAEVVAEKAPNVIICITPHGNVFSDGICILDEAIVEGSLAKFGYPHIKMTKEVDMDFNDILIDTFLKNNIPSIFLNNRMSKKYGGKLEIDHGILVPLYFIEQLYKTYKIVHISIGMLDLIELYQIGKILRKIIEENPKKAMILASGDLSHCLKTDGPYSYHPNGPIFDEMMVEAIQNTDFMKILGMSKEIYEAAGECGLRPITMGLGTLDGDQVSSTVFSYEGPFGVGYMTASIESLKEKRQSFMEEYQREKEKRYEEMKQREDEYLSLARTAIETWISKRKRLNWEEYKQQGFNLDVVKEMENNRAGAFVSIHRGGMLRGCIGTIQPICKNVAEEIIRNAIEASTGDPRFAPVRADELPYLEVKVDILHEIEEVQGEEELDVKRYGVIVETGERRGLLLPNLEGINTVSQQISIAKKKAGIEEHEKVKLYRFQVTRHE